MTIFTPGGLILYQYTAQPSLFQATDGPALTRQTINGELIKKILAVGNTNKSYHIVEGITMMWKKYPNYYIVALYPDIMFEGPRQYLKTWAEALLEQTAQEYDLYFNSCDQTKRKLRPDPAPFDKTFRVLLNTSKTQKHPEQQLQQAGGAGTNSTGGSSTETTSSAGAPNSKNSKPGKKEMRTWGEAKVTPSAMAALDKSNREEGVTQEDAAAAAHERALREAREAYLPTQAEVEQESDELELNTAATCKNDGGGDDSTNSSNSSWSSTVTGLFQQMTGNKVLQSSDLDAPLLKMEELLKEKNVAATIAHELCESVRQKLIGKRLNSMYRIQTAVQQALEGTLTKLLKRGLEVDLLRNVLQKRGDAGLFSKLSISQKRPYVITVMGINGIGKTTSLAKASAL